ncbi:MAG TPA: hypothetical protein VLM79_02595 [Kofleriaceae bacterium]|nr:hypothetical protein [Kofleriaceae bacterium]
MLRTFVRALSLVAILAGTAAAAADSPKPAASKVDKKVVKKKTVKKKKAARKAKKKSTKAKSAKATSSAAATRPTP